GGQNRVPAMVERLVFLGSATQVFVRLAPGSLLQVLIHNDGQPVPWSQGTPVSVHLPCDALRVLAAGGPEVSDEADELLRNAQLVGPGVATELPEHGAQASDGHKDMSAAST
ncbi:MAG: TOBE domain-containing protein, partial [Acidimicrobiales bacterium]